MPLNLDTYLGVQQDALKVQSKRMEVLAKNLANVDTPNYKAQDIDFKTALAQAGSPGSSLALTTTSANQIGNNATTWTTPPLSNTGSRSLPRSTATPWTSSSSKRRSRTTPSATRQL